MKKARKAMTKAKHAKTPVPSPTDTTAHAATPPEIMVSTPHGQELEWYFSYAETALRRNSVRILPSYAAIPILATEPTEAAFRARGSEIACNVRRSLFAVRGKHAEVLRAAYTPRAWPRSVEKAFPGVAAIAVRLAFADDPWPARPSRTGLERAAADQLAAAIKSGSLPVGRIRSQAVRLLDRAILAYAGQRALDAVETRGCR